MTEREYVLSLMVRRARQTAAHYAITTASQLADVLADDAATHRTGGAGPARGDTPGYSYACHHRGVWIGRWAHRHEGAPSIRWSEIAERALDVPRQAALL